MFEILKMLEALFHRRRADLVMMFIFIGMGILLCAPLAKLIFFGESMPNLLYRTLDSGAKRPMRFIGLS